MRQQVAVAGIGARQSFETGPECMITGFSSLIYEISSLPPNGNLIELLALILGERSPHR